MRSAGLLVVMLMSGCLRDNLVDCGNGVACPAGTACATVASNGLDINLCVDPGAFAPCDGLDDQSPCSAETMGGTCHGGACLPNVCGNARLDADEFCDDGNTVTGDGCSFGCASDERCGNGVIDPLAIVNDVVVPNEQCDDGGLLSHDGCSSGCKTELMRWESFTISLPTGKHSHALAYDSARDRMVLFGGAATGNFGVPLPRSDTWESDGTSWTKVPTSITPPARFGHVMAYDPVRRRTLLFGGTSAGSLFGDTWEWDGTSWLRLSPQSPPRPRRNAAATYDPVRGRLVVFGGETVNSIVLGDTWEWDGTEWMERQSTVSPDARMSARMAFDPVRGVSVLAGGLGAASSLLDDTWEYDGTTWTLRAARLPVAGELNGLAFDGASMIAFGISTNPTVATNTYRYNGTTWTRPLPIGTTEPGRRVNSSMVFDPRRSRAVMFGGFYSDPLCPGGCPASLGDVWTWDRTQWSAVSVAAPGERTHHASAYDEHRGCTVVFGGGSAPLTAFSSAETWELCGDRWAPRSGRQPTARVSGAMAYDSVRRRTVLFGGRNASGVLIGETDLWDGTTWTQVTGSGPSARTGHAMAFDPVRGTVVMFGGMTGSGVFLDETWEWNGTAWNEHVLPLGPRARVGHTMLFDPIRQRVLLLGGDSPFGTFADHWEWTGTGWASLSSTLLPPARSTYGVAWNAPRQRAVQVGGAAQFSLFDDVWESSGPTWSQQSASGGPLPRLGHSLTPTPSGVLMFGGYSGSFAMKDLWRLRWDDDHVNEACTLDADLDGDGLAGCADPDCWYVCSPQCPPGVSCAVSAPRCGDGVCNSAIETCRMCPGDCGGCPAACGDNFCDSPETTASCRGDCP